MLKKYFDWTPGDVAAWERIREKGLVRFILWWGLKVFGGGLFLILGAFYALKWLINGRMDAAGLGSQLLLVAAGCLIGGVVNALITWAVEEGIYQKILKKGKASQTPESK